jgi:hypothetical protein
VDISSATVVIVVVEYTVRLPVIDRFHVIQTPIVCDSDWMAAGGIILAAADLRYRDIRTALNISGCIIVYNEGLCQSWPARAMPRKVDQSFVNLILPYDKKGLILRARQRRYCIHL